MGWHGAANEELEAFEHEGLTLEPVPLSSSEVEDYYEGFSNATLWPLHHDAIATPQFHREWWETYVTVNERFADHVATWAAEGAVVGSGLPPTARSTDAAPPATRSTYRFFLHIPFPRPSLRPTSVAAADLEGLLGADLVGFQLRRRQNFVRLVRNRLGLETQRDRIRMPDGREVLASGVSNFHRRQ